MKFNDPVLVELPAVDPVPVDPPVFDPRYPLGTPVATAVIPPSKRLRPIAGRPNWFLNAHDQAVYVEPPVATV